ncbi:MAG TPA: glycosyltransferase family 4 protein [Chloroflexota bacterium]
MVRLTPQNAEFVIVSFEGPDEYSRAGGLAVRVRDLAEALAGQGFRTHLFFIGDPTLPGIEERGNLVLHRWGQWISEYHPAGVYDGEWEKMQDLAASLPLYLNQEIVYPASTHHKVTVLMGEDWQTVDTLVQTSHLLAQHSLLPHVIPVWTANNIFGFDGINWPSLVEAATLMTVSRYMKHEMWRWGIDPLVVPNGIASSSLVTVEVASSRRLRTAFGREIALFKIGRFSPDKRWIMALDAVAILKRMGTPARILIRGDRSAYGQEVLAHARAAGLRVENLADRYHDVADLAAAMEERPEADVLNLVSFLPDSLLPIIYAGVDGVLANSGHEPFGLVGLEVMGAGGVAFVGSTGEEYAEPDRNAVVLDTDDPREIVVQLKRLQGEPEEAEKLRRRARKTAQAYVWPEVLKELFTKMEYVALARGVEPPADTVGREQGPRR